MPELLPNIRNAARALIVRDGCVLLLRKRGADGALYYGLPGGAQETGESLEQALQRECEEEIDAPVTVEALLHVADYYKLRNSAGAAHRHHHVEFVFRCGLPGDYRPHNGPSPDKHQQDVVWMALDHPEVLSVRPHFLHILLQAEGAGSHSLYLGAFQDNDDSA